MNRRMLSGHWGPIPPPSAHKNSTERLPDLMKNLSKNQEASRATLIKLVGMRLTEVFYDGSEIVLEFDHRYRLQVSPKGCEIKTKKGSPEL
jgi:hypothetical protein